MRLRTREAAVSVIAFTVHSRVDGIGILHAQDGMAVHNQTVATGLRSMRHSLAVALDLAPSHDQTTYPSCQTRRRSARLRRHRHQRGSQRRRTSAGFRPARRADGAAMRATRRGARAEAAAEQAERQRQRPRPRQACLRAAPARRAARRRAVWRRSARSLRSPSRASPTASVCTARRTETNRVTNLRTAHASTMTTRFRLSNHTISDGIGTRKGLFDHTMRLQRVMLLLTLFLQPAACGRGLRSAHQPATI